MYRNPELTNTDARQCKSSVSHLNQKEQLFAMGLALPCAPSLKTSHQYICFIVTANPSSVLHTEQCNTLDPQLVKR